MPGVRSCKDNGRGGDGQAVRGGIARNGEGEAQVRTVRREAGELCDPAAALGHGVRTALKPQKQHGIYRITIHNDVSSCGKRGGTMIAAVVPRPRTPRPQTEAMRRRQPAAPPLGRD